MVDFKKSLENMVSQSQIPELPEELQNGVMFLWNHNLKYDKDWDNFTEGQKTMITTIVEKPYKVNIDTSTLEYGTSPISSYGMLENAETIDIYTSEYIDLDNKIVSIGNDIDTKYYAVSYRLDGFDTGRNKKQKQFLGKIVLVNIQKYLDQQFNDATTAPTINIHNGTPGTTIKVPKFIEQDARTTFDPNIQQIEFIDKQIPRVATMEIHFPKPAILIGGIDVVGYARENVPTSRKLVTTASRGAITDINDELEFPHQKLLCILPTQFNIPSLDNYGWIHPSDRSNVIKTLLATQTLGQAAQTGVDTAGSSGLISNLTQGIFSAAVGSGQKFFGDKGTLANSTATNSSFLEGEGDPIKFFIQGDGAGDDTANNVIGVLNDHGYMNLNTLLLQNDYIEINQGNGEFGKYGKSMSPSNNKEFNSLKIYRALGLLSINQQNERIPALATPYAGDGYQGLVITNEKISDYLDLGVVRKQVNSGVDLQPMVQIPEWDVYIRNMFFRPDPYSFWNWPCMMPAEIGVYDVKKRTDISYDTSNPVSDFIGTFGTLNDADTSSSKRNSYWNKTITVEQVTDNTFADKANTHMTFKYTFDEQDMSDKQWELQFLGITSSSVHINLYDDQGDKIRDYKFTSTGAREGTSASTSNILQM